MHVDIKTHPHTLTHCAPTDRTDSHCNHGQNSGCNRHILRFGNRSLFYPSLAIRVNITQGFEAIKQLLQQSEPYHFVLGVRDTTKTQAKYNSLDFDKSKHTITVFPLDLLSLPSVQSFAQNVLSQLGSQTLDYLFLCAGMLDSADGPGPNGSPWCSGCVVNHLGMWEVNSKGIKPR